MIHFQVRNTLVIQSNFIEVSSTWLSANILLDNFSSKLIQADSICKWFAVMRLSNNVWKWPFKIFFSSWLQDWLYVFIIPCWLHTKLLMNIPNMKPLTIHSAKAYTPIIRISPCKLWNVGSWLTRFILLASLKMNNIFCTCIIYNCDNKVTIWKTS